jgi:hypothetical protein
MQPIYQTNIYGKKISNKLNDDVYCQSYTLMRAYGIHISTNVYDRQMAMIQMYRDILKDKKLMKELYDTLVVTSWVDKTVTPNKPFKTHDMKSKIPKKIKETLDDWENFGYWRVIGKGNCPNNQTIKNRNNTLKQKKRHSYRNKNTNTYKNTNTHKNRSRSRNRNNNM